MANYTRIIGGSRGAAGTPSPNGIQFFCFHKCFLQKSARIGGWHPPNGLVPPPTGNPGSITENERTEQIL